MAIGLIFILSPSGLFLRFVSPWLTGFDRPPNTYIFPDEYGFLLILGLMLKEIPFLVLVSLSALREFSSTKFFDLGKSFQHSIFSTWFILIFPIIYKKIRLVIFIIIAFRHQWLICLYFWHHQLLPLYQYEFCKSFNLQIWTHSS